MIKALWLLGAASTAAVTATVVDFDAAKPSAAVASRPAAGVSGERGPSSAGLVSSLERPGISGQMKNVFGGRIDRPVVATAPATPAPEPRAAFPYRYAGRLTESGKITAFLTGPGGSGLRFVEPGQVIDGAWRITAAGSDSLEVVHVASGEAASIVLSGAGGDAEPVAQNMPSQQTSSSSIGPTPTAESAPARAPAATPAGRLAAASAIPGSATPSGRGSQAQAQAQAQPPAQAAPRTDAPISSGAVPAGQLGLDAPAAGSMPVGPAPAAKGKLGL